MPTGSTSDETGPRCSAVVLASGASRRLGRSKLEVTIDGTPAIARIVDILADVRVAPIVVVVGRDAAIARRLLGARAVDFVPNAEWERGRTGSVQRGLAEIPDDRPTVLWPVDHPLVEAKTVGELLSHAARDSMALWTLPTFEGRGGHPVIIQPGAFGRIRALAPDAPLRILLPGLGPQVARVPTSDPGVRMNLDSPEAVAEARSVGLREGRWIVD